MTVESVYRPSFCHLLQILAASEITDSNPDFEVFHVYANTVLSNSQGVNHGGFGAVLMVISMVVALV